MLIDLANCGLGEVHLLREGKGTSRRTSPAVTWKATLASTLSPSTNFDDMLFYKCQSLVAASGDIARPNDTVLVRNYHGPTKLMFAKLKEVLASDSSTSVAHTTVIQVFEVGKVHHEVYDAPIITLSDIHTTVFPQARSRLDCYRQHISEANSLSSPGCFVCR